MTKQAHWQYQPGWGLLFVLPALLGLIALTYGPSAVSFALSFTDWDLLGPLRPVGLANYQSLLTSTAFWQILGNTALFVGCVVSGQLTLGFALAWGLYRLARGAVLARLLYFLPYVTPMVAVALVFGWLFEGEQGLTNQLLLSTGWIDQPRAWLHLPQTAMLGVIILEIWKTLGYTMLLLLAGLQGLPPAVLEASTLDGATGWQQVRHVVLPMVLPTLALVALLTVLHSLQAFDAIYLLTSGGPQKATTVLVFWVYQQAFEFYQAGLASAVAYVLFALVALLTLAQWGLRRRATSAHTAPKSLIKGRRHA